MRNFDERTWLSWLVKVRIIIITFLLGIGLAIVAILRASAVRRTRLQRRCVRRPRRQVCYFRVSK